MTEMCGEIADGMIGQAFTTKRYLDEVTIPTFQRGIKRSGRGRRDFQLMCPARRVRGRGAPAGVAHGSIDWQRLAVRGVVLAVTAEQHRGCSTRFPLES
jgi:hypothetical protein